VARRSEDLHGHPDCDSPDSDVLKPVYAMPCIPYRLDGQIDAQNEDERANNHDSCRARKALGLDLINRLRR
jgi:hypothetical protein